MNLFPFLILVGLLNTLGFAADAPKPKYGPDAVPLSISHEYFKHAAAPDYWALAPFYAAQMNERACSTGAAVAALNALRGSAKLTTEDELITQESLTAKPELTDWKKAVGDFGHGVTLDELEGYLKKALPLYGFKKFEVTATHAVSNDAKTLAAFRTALKENEKSASTIILINFLQGVVTGDADVGHLASIGAYDEKNHKVLIMDPDRKWYEPYWTKDETALKSMATPDKISGKNRGWIWIKAE